LEREVLTIVLGQRLVRRVAMEDGWSISVEKNDGVWPKRVGQEMEG
jgi:hypothetical protein